jgi:hypothetical protein
VHADDALELAQDLTGLDAGTHSSQLGDAQFEHRFGLLDLDLLELGDLDRRDAALGQVLVQLRGIGRGALGCLEEADTRGVEGQVLDAAVFFQDRTDPVRR